jgi:hypothetical protein
VGRKARNYQGRLDQQHGWKPLADRPSVLRRLSEPLGTPKGSYGDDAIMCRDGSERYGRVKDTFAHGNPALDGEGGVCWLARSADSLRHSLFSLSCGSRPDRNPCTPRDSVFCDRDEALLPGHEAQDSVAVEERTGSSRRSAIDIELQILSPRQLAVTSVTRCRQYEGAVFSHELGDTQ